MNQSDGLPINEIVPIKLIPGQERVAGYIDGLNAILKIYGVKPSTFLEGATFLCNPYINHNPDWIAQSAHSFREIGYLFSGAPTKRGRSNFLIRILPALRTLEHFFPSKIRAKKVEEIIRVYLEEAEAAFLAARITEMTHIFADISHHHSSKKGNAQESLKRLRKLGIAKDIDVVIDENIFLALAKGFLSTISETISANLTIHRKIDLFCESLKENKADRRYLAFLLASTPDARKYFFAVAPIASINWIWTNGFLDVIKERSDDLTRYRLPELDYLTRVAESNPKRVVDFMLSFDTTVNINLETIDRFLWICTKLPAKELVRIVSIIRDKKWIQILGGRNHWGFGYKQMLDTLVTANERGSVLVLAEAILAVRSKEDVKRSSFGSVENPFYFNDLHYSEVFERLSEISGKKEEDVLKLTLKTLMDVVLLSGEKEDDIFSIGDMFSLFDVDFFTLSFEHDRHLSSRDDVRDLSAVAKIYADKLITKSCDNPGEVRRLYNTYVVPLPDARTMWRFRLYVWSLCPTVFANELRDAFFRGFESEKTLWPITGGSEYEQALRKAFSVLSIPDREKYIQRAFELFESLGKEHPYGFGILSSIYEFLTDDDRKRAEALYKHPLKPDFQPEPSIGRLYAGMVVPQTPSGSEDEWVKPINDIVQLLKTKWTPEELQKMDTHRDFLRPINAEGVAGMLPAKIKERLSEYVANATLFFDRDQLDAHYTYTYLRGVQEAVRSDRASAAQLDWGPVVELGKAIVLSGTTKSFETTRESEKFDAWLSGWSGVLSSLSDLLKEVLHAEGNKLIIDFDLYRNDLLSIIRFLLSYPDPQPADEKIETAKMKSKSPGENEYEVSDPLTTAINTTRGRAFETFVFFVEQDSKKFPKETKSKISADIATVYEEVLKNENTNAIMFMFGHYVAFFYYRDAEWIEKTIMPLLFPKDTTKKDLYLAAWEGYLSSTLYDELFKKFHDEYARAIALDPTTYTKRKYRSDLDEAIAIHLALAYVHFGDFNFDSDLYKAFWSNINPKRWAEFVSFIGRSVISRDRPKDWLKEHSEVNPKKLEAYWDWALDNCDDKKTLQGFGFWMQTKDDIFDTVWLADHIDRTLEKTGGDIEWEIGFVDSLPTLANKAPEKTLSALRRYLIDGSILKKARGYIRVDGNLIDAMKTLYTNNSTKGGTYKLINELLPIGGGQFWGLKDILK